MEPKNILVFYYFFEENPLKKPYFSGASRLFLVAPHIFLLQENKFIQNHGTKTKTMELKPKPWNQSYIGFQRKNTYFPGASRPFFGALSFSLLALIADHYLGMWFIFETSNVHRIDNDDELMIFYFLVISEHWLKARIRFQGFHIWFHGFRVWFHGF